MNTAKYYGVSTGNGNDGVSQSFPDFIVNTNQPWLLAELAALSYFKDGEGKAWAKENMEIDGDEDYTISATFMESSEQQEERERAEEEEEGSTENWDTTAWFIVEVFPLLSEGENHYRPRCPVYDSLSEAFNTSDILDVYDGYYPMITTWHRVDQSNDVNASKFPNVDFSQIVRCNHPFGKGFIRVN